MLSSERENRLENTEKCKCENEEQLYKLIPAELLYRNANETEEGHGFFYYHTERGKINGKNGAPRN